MSINTEEWDLCPLMDSKTKDFPVNAKIQSSGHKKSFTFKTAKISKGLATILTSPRKKKQ